MKELQHRRLRSEYEREIRGNRGEPTLWCSDAECTGNDTERKLLDKSQVNANIDNRYCAATVVSWLHCWGWGMSRREMCVRLFFKEASPSTATSHAQSDVM